MDLREVLGHRPCEALFMLFPLQQVCLSHRLLHVVLVVLVVFPLSASHVPILPLRMKARTRLARVEGVALLPPASRKEDVKVLEDHATRLIAPLSS